MGLDFVELILEVEEEFGIDIEDEEAEECSTVGALHRLVLSKLKAGKGRNGPPTACAFWRLRQGLMEVAGVGRRRVRPETRLEELIPRRGRRAAWERLEARTGLRLPGFRLSGWVVGPMMMTGAALGLWAGWGAGAGAPWTRAGWAAAGGLGGGLLGLAPRLHLEWEREIETVWDLAQRVRVRPWLALRRKRGEWIENEVFEHLRKVIVYQTGVSPEEVVPGASFVDDLGLC